MKRLFFTLSVIIVAGLVTTAYSQVSIHASINLGGRSGIYVNQSPVVYEPACTPPPPPPCYDNGYNRGHIEVVIGHPGYDRRYDERRREVRYYERDRNYRDCDHRDRDRRDFDRDHDRWRNR